MSKYRKPCLLYDRECIGCGECDRCDLDPEKICDNCMKCVRGDADYRGIKVDGILLEHEMAEDANEMNKTRKKYPTIRKT